MRTTQYQIQFRQQPQNENEVEDNSNIIPYDDCVCLKNCGLVYQCRIILLLFIESIISIVVCSSNQDQAQIYYAVLINVLIQIINILLFLFIIRSSIKFQYKLKQFCTQEQIKNYIIDDQKQHIPIHYFIIYSNVIQLLLVLKFKGGTGNTCKYFEYEYEDNSNCQSYYIYPEFSGNYTEGYADNIYFQISFILCYELFFGLFAFIIPQKISEQFIESIDKKSNKKYSCILLNLFICYSCFKIIIYVVFLSNGEYSSSNILLISNICFHIIMILICLRAYCLISSDNQCENYDYFNYFSPISNIFMDDNCSMVLFIFCGSTLPVTIKGIIEHQTVDTKEIINWNYFIIFDCCAVQITTIAIIIFIFIVMSCYFKCVDEDKQPDEEQQNQQQIQRNVETQEEIKRKLQRKIQNKLSPFIFKVKLQGNNDCTICLQKMIEDEQQIIVQLKCHKTHIFHLQCIQQWLKQNRKCPICNEPQQQF